LPSQASALNRELLVGRAIVLTFVGSSFAVVAAGMVGLLRPDLAKRAMDSVVGVAERLREPRELLFDVARAAVDALGAAIERSAQRRLAERAAAAAKPS
jgi:hypothetical protein